MGHSNVVPAMATTMSGFISTFVLQLDQTMAGFGRGGSILTGHMQELPDRTVKMIADAGTFGKEVVLGTGAMTRDLVLAVADTTGTALGLVAEKTGVAGGLTKITDATASGTYTLFAVVSVFLGVAVFTRVA